MITVQTDIRRLVLVRLNPGDDLLEGIERAVARESLRNAIIMNGFGSVKAYHYHVVANTEMRPSEAFPKGVGARDILSLSGAIIDGLVHAHLSLSDDTRAEGGHLEPGTVILTFAGVVLADIGDTSLAEWDAVAKFLGE